MISAVFYGNRNIQIRKNKIKKVKNDELLIKVMASGICGTDILFYNGKCSYINLPVILGHEYSGEVVEIGEDVNNIQIGDRVAIDPTVFCCECFYCCNGQVHLCDNMFTLGVNKDGGFSQYSLVPCRSVYKLENNISFEEGALLEPISCCIHGLDKLKIQLGDVVMLSGFGLIGFIMLQLLKIYGASKVIVLEPKADRRELAEKFGANYILNPNNNIDYNIKQIVQNGADILIECSGNPLAQENAFSFVKKGGKILFFGCSPDFQKIFISTLS
ncbi:MAG: alcohol dehydrogenase catalytic domain-containing protein [Actinobacteria bacterium]|nr:alcohol dehydrogenase catalytic domain-containing protein [Cyanobacteriota bacterium]MCL5771348.1 alcohol dehydrogenase catalytic domain-containing protein [Actinomycetota bacterium]